MGLYIPKTRAKYGSSKITIDGIVFDSQAEATRYGELLMLQRAGKIKGLELQPRFTVWESKSTGEKIVYVADFAYLDIDHIFEVVEDVKGVETPVYKLKRKMFQAYLEDKRRAGKAIKFIEVKK